MPRRQRQRHEDVLGPATRHDDAVPSRHSQLQSVVLVVCQLHQFLASAASTSVARSTSSTSMYSSAACASPMSPGPKQIAGTPASLRSAASVHALIPDRAVDIPRSRSVALSAATIGASGATSLGGCANSKV